MHLLIAMIIGAVLHFALRALWDSYYTRTAAGVERDHRIMVAAQNLRDHAGAVARLEGGKVNMGSPQILEVWAKTAIYARRMPVRQANALWQAIHERAGRAASVKVNESGQALVEYTLILSLIALVAIPLLREIGLSIVDILETINDAIR